MRRKRKERPIWSTFFCSMGSGDLRGSGGYHDSVGPVGGDFLFSLCS
jgi:hypothetical protein